VGEDFTTRKVKNGVTAETTMGKHQKTNQMRGDWPELVAAISGSGEIKT
jgi:hypothetical protein